MNTINERLTELRDKYDSSKLSLTKSEYIELIELLEDRIIEIMKRVIDNE